MNAGPFDLVFMDFFGTLADGDAHAVEGVCAAVIRDAGLNMEVSWFAQHWSQQFFDTMDLSNGAAFRTIRECERLSLEATARQFGAALDPVPYIDVLQDYCRNAPLHEDAQEVLDALAVPVCIVSNADELDLRAAVARCGLCVSGVVSSEAARSYKPDRGIFEHALGLMNVAPSRCLHVGDSRHSDVGGAAAMGMTSAWLVRDRRVGDAPSRQPAPDYVIRSLREVLLIVHGE